MPLPTNQPIFREMTRKGIHFPNSQKLPTASRGKKLKNKVIFGTKSLNFLCRAQYQNNIIFLIYCTKNAGVPNLLLFTLSTMAVW